MGHVSAVGLEGVNVSHKKEPYLGVPDVVGHVGGTGVNALEQNRLGPAPAC